jgi:hypothetical protein
MNLQNLSALFARIQASQPASGNYTLEAGPRVIAKAKELGFTSVQEFMDYQLWMIDSGNSELQSPSARK